MPTIGTTHRTITITTSTRTGYIPGNEAAHLLNGEGGNTPVIHAFLVVEGTVRACVRR